MTTSESFRKDVAEKLDAVIKSSDGEASVSFPSCLSAEERKYIHHIAEQFGLKHESKGRGDARFICVSRDLAKARRRGLQGGQGVDEEPLLSWPTAAWEALAHPLVAHSAKGQNTEAAESSSPLEPVSPRTIDRMLGTRPLRQPPKQALTKGIKETSLLAIRRSLPAWTSREGLIEAASRHQVTLVVGETGCGKSTQVPQFLLEDCPDASIVVTQPRRISALSLAHRIAQEREESVGNVVGYSVHLDHQSSAQTQLLVCTAGVLRRRLLEEPRLETVTHIVLDELHERDKPLLFPARFRELSANYGTTAGTLMPRGKVDRAPRNRSRSPTQVLDGKAAEVCAAQFHSFAQKAASLIKEASRKSAAKPLSLTEVHERLETLLADEEKQGQQLTRLRGKVDDLHRRLRLLASCRQLRGFGF
eukprot:s4620_g1.t1